MTSNIAVVEAMVKSVAGIPADDGLIYDLASVHGEPIRDEADYEGTRVHLTARLATATIPFHVDVNFGDPIWPAPTIAQPKWAAWRRKQHLTENTPEQFQQVIDVCIAFADPVLSGHADHTKWLPTTHAWTEP